MWGDEYLCPFCRIKVSLDVVDKLSTIDQRGLGIFAYPVTEAVAKNYFDVIRNPMDLQTMKENATRGTYKSMQSLRQDWELMSLNAILFNKSGDEYWLEAKRFYEYGLLYFDSLPRSSHHSAFGAEIRILIEKFYQANPNLRPVCQEKVKKRGRYTVEEPVPSLSSTVSQFETEKISQIPESEVAETFIPEPEIEFQIPLPTDLAIPLDPTSYIPCFASTMPMDHALIICQRDQCLMCGSTDSEEFMLICIDCGEVCHSFCAEAPLATMDALARRHWRCTNCKICEACGTASESDSCSLMYCDRCDRSYHNTCMIPQVPELEESESWICAACVSCTKCAGYTTNTHINADPSVANNEMNTDTINSDVVNISKVYTPVWGIKVDECIRCHREEVEKREKEEREISSKNMILYKEMIDHVENRSTRVCGVCALQCYTDSHVLCNECQQHFHLACMKNLCEPWIPNNRLNSDFICISCLSAHTAQKYSSTHMGIIANCLPVVIDAAKIQRRQTQCLIQNDAEVKVLATATYRAEAEKHRRVLKVIYISSLTHNLYAMIFMLSS